MARTSTRERMVIGAAGSIRRYGASATSIDRVLAVSRAPRGSVYHHFPGGRTQLVAEAVTYAGERVGAQIAAAAAHGSPVRVLEEFIEMWRDQLVTSGYRDGCPVVAVAVESSDEDPQLTDAAGAAFDQWSAQLGDLMVDAGVPSGRAARLATLVIAAVEGALVLGRAQRSTRPLDDVGVELRDLLGAALQEAGS